MHNVRLCWNSERKNVHFLLIWCSFLRTTCIACLLKCNNVKRTLLPMHHMFQFMFFGCKCFPFQCIKFRIKFKGFEDESQMKTILVHIIYAYVYSPKKSFDVCNVDSWDWALLYSLLLVKFAMTKYNTEYKSKLHQSIFMIRHKRISWR